ncbi:hypothetical protein J6590_036828 [Homalodisca vitripennis]|nr:hypothetical protein J6590_036828 [Homalodisca vitripennis]
MIASVKHNISHTDIGTSGRMRGASRAVIIKAGHYDATWLTETILVPRVGEMAILNSKPFQFHRAIYVDSRSSHQSGEVLPRLLLQFPTVRHRTAGPAISQAEFCPACYFSSRPFETEFKQHAIPISPSHLHRQQVQPSVSSRPFETEFKQHAIPISPSHLRSQQVQPSVRRSFAPFVTSVPDRSRPSLNSMPFQSHRAIYVDSRSSHQSDRVRPACFFSSRPFDIEFKRHAIPISSSHLCRQQVQPSVRRSFAPLVTSVPDRSTPSLNSMPLQSHRAIYVVSRPSHQSGGVLPRLLLQFPTVRDRSDRVRPACFFSSRPFDTEFKRHAIPISPSHLRRQQAQPSVRRSSPRLLLQFPTVHTTLSYNKGGVDTRDDKLYLDLSSWMYFTLLKTSSVN